MIKKNIFNINLDPVSDEDDGSTGGDFSELTDDTNSIITLDKEDKELINLLDQLMRENNQNAGGQEISPSVGNEQFNDKLEDSKSNKKMCRIDLVVLNKLQSFSG